MALSTIKFSYDGLFAYHVITTDAKMNHMYYFQLVELIGNYIIKNDFDNNENLKMKKIKVYKKINNLIKIRIDKHIEIEGFMLKHPVSYWSSCHLNEEHLTATFKIGKIKYHISNLSYKTQKLPMDVLSETRFTFYYNKQKMSINFKNEEFKKKFVQSTDYDNYLTLKDTNKEDVYLPYKNNHYILRKTDTSFEMGHFNFITGRFTPDNLFLNKRHNTRQYYRDSKDEKWIFKDDVINEFTVLVN